MQNLFTENSLNTDNRSQSTKMEEVNVILEPEFKIAKHKSLSLSVLPSVGISNKTYDIRERKIDSSTCRVLTDDEVLRNVQLPASCYSSKSESKINLTQGLNIKMTMEDEDGVGFFIQTGIINDKRTQQVSSVGFSVSF